MTRFRTLATAAAALFPLALVTATGAGAAGEITPLLAGFAVLAGSTVTNTGATTIYGDIGVSPGSAFTDAGAVTQTGALHLADPVGATAQTNLATALVNLSTVGNDLTGSDLGNLALIAGVYSFTSAAQLTGTLTLDAEGDPNAVFIIVVGSSLTTASNSSVALIHGAQGSNVYWVMPAGSATLGTGTAFAGHILAGQSISLNTGATINCGAALAQTGAVTMDTNTISTLCALTTDTFALVLGPTGTAAQAAIAAWLDAFMAANGGISALPLGMQALLTDLSPDELAAALTQLSGESNTGAASAGMRGMDSFLSTLFDSAFGEDNRSNDTTPTTVRTLGYASDGPPPDGATTALASFGKGPVNPWPVTVWASGYGGYNFTAGDDGLGTHDRSTTLFGAAAGYSRQIAANTTVGMAFGAGVTSFGLTDGLGGGNNTMLQAAVYARKTLDAAYIAAAAAYAYNHVTTSRNVILPDLDIPVNDHYSAAYSAHNIAAEVEVGYRFGWIAPYAALRAGAFFTPAYSETGPVPFADSYDARTATSLRTELGARFEHLMAVHDSSTLTLRARLAWAHDWVRNPAVATGFVSVPDGSTFLVEGAQADADSLLVSAGAELGFGNGFAIGGKFDGEFAANSQTYSGTGRISYQW